MVTGQWGNVVEAAQIPVEHGRVGSRWINYRPSAEEVADWFQTVRLHEGMEHQDWLSGITLIEATEKHDHITGFASDGRPQVMKDVESLHLIPYPRVDARVAYFNRLMELTEDWTGFILPVPAADPKGMAVGFYAMKVALPDGKLVSAVCYTARILVIEGEVVWEPEVDPDGVERRYPHGDVILAGAHGTKSVPLVDRWGRFDANAVMKAQTGGVGRALGYAGMLVIPGTGVATAEDMREAQDQGSIPGSPSAAPDAAEERPSGDLALRAEAVEIIGLLKERHPEALAEFQAWAKERKFRKLSEIQGPALKGLVRKLQKIREAQADKEPEVAEQGELLLDGGEAATPVEAPEAKEEAL
jgi:hypothetical protein